uniref:Anaphase-promoting complex subunit 10 n=1 Tax=Pelusios castaneus TaxID=367368 RepID=A0A8C8R9L8_9SAUR
LRHPTPPPHLRTLADRFPAPLPTAAVRGAGPRPQQGGYEAGRPAVARRPCRGRPESHRARVWAGIKRSWSGAVVLRRSAAARTCAVARQGGPGGPPSPLPVYCTGPRSASFPAGGRPGGTPLPGVSVKPCPYGSFRSLAHLPAAPEWEMTTPNKTPPGADPKQLERTGTVREIGSQAVWSLSSCKPGFGVDQLRDDNLETYWQSDGSQPHLVNIQFRRKTTVKTLCIYADYKSDESYTPSKISVRVGNNFHNLQEIRM